MIKMMRGREERKGRKEEGERREAKKMALNLLLEACMRKGEIDKMHGIMEAIRGMERKQLRYLNMIWKRLLGITSESKLPPSITRQMPCIIGGENKHNLIPSYEGGEMQGKGKSITRQKGKAERGKAFRLSSRPEKRRYKEVCVKWLRM